MKLIIKAGADRHYENLPIANEVTIIIPNKYENTNYHNIIFADHGPPKVLATRSIEAWALQGRCRQACTIGLFINEDTKLEKGKEKGRRVVS